MSSHSFHKKAFIELFGKNFVLIFFSSNCALNKVITTDIFQKRVQVKEDFGLEYSLSMTQIINWAQLFSFFIQVIELKLSQNYNFSKDRWSQLCHNFTIKLCLNIHWIESHKKQLEISKIDSFVSCPFRLIEIYFVSL